MSKRKRVRKKAAANRKAQVIFNVRSGAITATEGAQILDVSRKTYYVYENRALDAMAKALEEGDPGRPQTPAIDPEKTAMHSRIKELEAELENLRLQTLARKMLDELEARQCASGLSLENTKKKSKKS